MSVSNSLLKQLGTWKGPSRLWLSPETAAHESTSSAAIALAAKQNAISFAYTWAFDGDPQEGLLLLTENKTGLQAVWIDSFHTSGSFMICQGSSNDEGVVSVKGSYAAPPGPDWGWRIVIDPGGANQLKLIMYNITPEGEESLAVEALYARQTE